LIQFKNFAFAFFKNVYLLNFLWTNTKVVKSNKSSRIYKNKVTFFLPNFENFLLLLLKGVSGKSSVKMFRISVKKIACRISYFFKKLL